MGSNLDPKPNGWKIEKKTPNTFLIYKNVTITVRLSKKLFNKNKQGAKRL